MNVLDAMVSFAKMYVEAERDMYKKALDGIELIANKENVTPEERIKLIQIIVENSISDTTKYREALKAQGLLFDT